ncbi:MAG: DUF5615 family PIN-like protein [Actinomycetales bacterium]
MDATAERPPLRIVLDHHYPFAVVTGLRKLGVDAQTAAEHDWHAISDEALLDSCWQLSAVLVTNNVTDFVPIARDWHLQGRSHAGLLLTSDRRWPRHRAGSGPLTQAIHHAVHVSSSSGQWVDRIVWLVGPSTPVQ